MLTISYILSFISVTFLTIFVHKLFETGLYGNSKSSSTFYLSILSFSCLFATVAANIYIIFICVLILKIRAQFRAFNDTLKSQHQNLKEFSSIFIQLCEIVDEFNGIFAQSMAITMTGLFSGTTFHFYDLYSVLSSSRVKNYQIGYSVSANLWSFFVNFFMMSFIVCCGLTMMEGRKSLGILQRKLNIERNLKVKKVMKVFILQLKHLQPKFSCGFFDFDWATIQMVRFYRFLIKVYMNNFSIGALSSHTSSF